MDGHDHGEAFWVFAYGSLIWNPGFAFEERATAVLRGWHRAMCILSTHYRGCAETPGLVLDWIMAGPAAASPTRIHEREVPEVRRYLDDRELVTGVYHPRMIAMTLLDGRRVKGYVYVAKRNHGQYAGPLDAERAAALIRQGNGPAPDRAATIWPAPSPISMPSACPTRPCTDCCGWSTREIEPDAQ